MQVHHFQHSLKAIVGMNTKKQRLSKRRVSVFLYQNIWNRVTGKGKCYVLPRVLVSGQSCNNLFYNLEAISKTSELSFSLICRSKWHCMETKCIFFFSTYCTVTLSLKNLCFYVACAQVTTRAFCFGSELHCGHLSQCLRPQWPTLECLDLIPSSGSSLQLPANVGSEWQ